MNKTLMLIGILLIIIPITQAGTIYHLRDFNTETSKEFIGYEGDAFDFLFNGYTHTIIIKDVEEKNIYIKVFPYKKAGTGVPIAYDRYALIDLDKNDIDDFKIELNGITYDKKIASIIITKINEDSIKEYEDITGNVIEEDSNLKANFKIGAIITIVIILLGFFIFRIFSKK